MVESETKFFTFLNITKTVSRLMQGMTNGDVWCKNNQEKSNLISSCL